MNKILQRMRIGATTCKDADELMNRIMRLVPIFFFIGLFIGGKWL